MASAFERRSYNLEHHRLSLQIPNTSDPVICDYWSKLPPRGKDLPPRRDHAVDRVPSLRNNPPCNKSNSINRRRTIVLDSAPSSQLSDSLLSGTEREKSGGYNVRHSVNLSTNEDLRNYVNCVNQSANENGRYSLNLSAASANQSLRNSAGSSHHVRTSFHVGSTNGNPRNYVNNLSSTNQNTHNCVNPSSTNQTSRNWVDPSTSTNQNSRNRVDASTSTNQNPRNCVNLLEDNKVKVKIADEVHEVTLRRRKVKKHEEEPEVREEIEKRSPIQDIFKRLTWRYRKKKKVDKDVVGRRRPHSFVNSQEWTISRAVPDLKLGILGTVNSGKSALVHRYLTGSYMQEESPEGGRFKKEVVIDGQSYLLLIRDEGSAPEMQFSLWVDAVIFVFSLENENSFNTIYSYYAKMAHYRNTAEVPIILVGTQDAISESNPRLIDDQRARKLANDLRRCSYYETCATYGLNVERVFQDACQKIIHIKTSTGSGIPPGVSHTPTNSRPTTPAAVAATPPPRFYANSGAYPIGGSGGGAGGDSSSGGGTLPNTPQQTISASSSTSSGKLLQQQQQNSSHFQGHSPTTLPAKDHRHDKKHKDRHKHNKTATTDHDTQQAQQQQFSTSQHSSTFLHNKAIAVAPPTVPSVPPPTGPPPPPNQGVGMSDPHAAEMVAERLQQHQLQQQQQQQHQLQHQHSYHDPSVTPGSTPVPRRKDKKSSQQSHSIQKSNSFSGPALGQRNSQNGETITLPTPTSTPVLSRKNKNNKSFIGSGKNKVEEGADKSKSEQLGSGRTIPIKQGHLYKKSNKPLSKDWKKKYVALGANGKMTYFPSINDYMDDVHGKEINLQKTTVKIPGALRPRGSGGNQNIQTNPNHQNGKAGNGTKDGTAAVLTAFNPIGGEEGSSVVIPNSSVTPGLFNGDPPPAGKQIETPNVKKRHRRAKSGTKNLDPGGDDSDGYEFMIVSLDNKQWQFEAGSVEERDGWVTSIEQSILSSLQGMESNKAKARTTVATDPQSASVIRQQKGNDRCADCDTPDPDWASLNIGALICIECSGIHRNLGTHLSRVRSLELDEWPPELVAVMSCIGNTLANSVWEANPKGMTKPTPTSPRDEKERWIRGKYEAKEFMPPPPYLDVPLPQQLIDAIARQDVHNTILVLGYCKAEHVNAPYSKTDKRTALHIAAALGNVVLVQLLLWYMANVKVVDHENRNALWYARSANSSECVELLKSQGCPEHPTLPRRPRQPPGQGGQPGGQGGQSGEAFDKLPASVI